MSARLSCIGLNLVKFKYKSNFLWHFIIRSKSKNIQKLKFKFNPIDYIWDSNFSFQFKFAYGKKKIWFEFEIQIRTHPTWFISLIDLSSLIAKALGNIMHCDDFTLVATRIN